MTKPKLLYVSINDGSDPRINKEIRSLAARFEVYFLGIGQNPENSFTKSLCQEFWLVEGHHRSIWAFLRYFGLFFKAFFKHKYATYHVINEQLFMVLLPFLWFVRKRVVIDVFDSIFLKVTGGFMATLQPIVYNMPKCLVVTDDNRKALVPPRFLPKTTVVENYPYRFNEVLAKKSQSDELLIQYSGAIYSTRGTDLLRRMVETSPKVTIWMVGWIRDEVSRQLSTMPQVKYWGAMPQNETLRMASECDYIMSVYEPIHENNINASPNKIFDAIQVGTPVVINGEVKVSAFVAEYNLGYVLENYYEPNAQKVIDELIARKKTFAFDQSLQEKYTWEAVEGRLIEAHLLDL